MANLIQLLPDHVANQIAAGEVVQRPASVVKEMVENSIDAGSTKIQVILKDAGKTLIQIIDNGCGMHETDARMCFERHATSKISKANDLFDIRTMGFRGEAMASISAIATVEMKTRQTGAETGVHIVISGSKIEKQEPVACPTGTNIMVKNLFFNVPARRKFLKKNSTELKHILEEFQRVALGFPEVQLRLVHNDVELYNLPPSKIFHRVINILGRSASSNMVPIESETSMGKIIGYVGKPQNAKKTAGEQFFFVNKRFMKHPYFYKAVVSAYEGIMHAGLYPSFFIYFDVDPSTIDINIHPTKTEIKFEHEKDLWPILLATVKEGLGKVNLAPSIDFDRETNFEIPTASADTQIKPPTITVNPNYNPFDTDNSTSDFNSASSESFGSSSVETRSSGFSAGRGTGNSGGGGMPKTKTFASRGFGDSGANNWEKLYSGFENAPSPEMPEARVEPSKVIESQTLLPQEEEAEQTQINTGTGSDQSRCMQIKGRYILTPVKSGIMLIDQKRAHERILFDELSRKVSADKMQGQRLLYPEKIELSPIESGLLASVTEELTAFGFDIQNFGSNTFVVNSTPSQFGEKPVMDWIQQILDSLKNDQKEFSEQLQENMLKSMAKFLSIPYGKSLSPGEMADMIDRLFASPMPNLSPSGKTILTILAMDDLEKKFN